MTTAPPTKPNTNSSMHPGLMALCWHGETPEPGGLHGGQRGIFVVRICHSAAATKTMPSAAAFHSILQQLRSDDVTRSPHLKSVERLPPTFMQLSRATGSLLTTLLSTRSPGLAHWLPRLEIYIIYSHSYIKEESLTLSKVPLSTKKDWKPGELESVQRSHKSEKFKSTVIPSIRKK